MREAVQAAGGEVLAERYFPVGETDFAAVIRQILDARPGFVFNTLIGVSAYAFFRAFRAAALARGIDQPRAVPVASCSLAEPELVEIGPEACAGHVSSSVYFESIDTPANRAFVAAYRRRFPGAGPTSADVESSYVAVHLLARAIRRAGTPDMAAVRAALPHVAMEAPQGRVLVDGDNRHCHLTPRIGVSTRRAASGSSTRRPARCGPTRTSSGTSFARGPRPQPKARPMSRRPIQNFRGLRRRHRGAGRRQPGRPGGDARAAGPRGDVPPHRASGRRRGRYPVRGRGRARSRRRDPAPSGGTTALVAVIGHETPSRLQRAYELEPSAFLMKPIRPSGVFTAVYFAANDTAGAARRWSGWRGSRRGWGPGASSSRPSSSSSRRTASTTRRRTAACAARACGSG